MPSILNPPITDLLNDPRVTSEALIKMLREQQTAITQTVGELSKRLQPTETTPYNGMMFALLQHQVSLMTLLTSLHARNMDLTYKNHQLALRLDRLTKWLIGLTIVLGIFALPLAIDVATKWFH